ncbi:MAG: site-specific DNA-methyltransferase [Candidatus Aenigmatarchaeota archaeon]
MNLLSATTQPSLLSEGIKFITGDSRTFIPPEEIHLVVTSPPYFNLIDYSNERGIENNTYNDFIEDLSKVFANIFKVLCPGGTVCINITNVKSRKSVEGESFLYPVVPDIVKTMIRLGYIFFDEIIWLKGWGNNGALKGKPLFGSYPYPPTPKILDSIFENILIFKKQGRRKVLKEVKNGSKLSKEEWIEFTRGVWIIEPDRKAKHPAVFPLEIPLRLVKMYSFIGDIVYDPFAGTGTTLIAAYMTGRQGIGVEINPEFKSEFAKKCQEYLSVIPLF